MQGLNKKVYAILFFSILATMTGVGLVVPLLPVYAKNLGGSGFQIALIFVAFAIARTVFIPFFGRKSDLRGRKPFIVAGMFFYAIVSFLFVLADTTWQLIFFRTLQGIASAMVMPVVQAYVGDITPEGFEGASMGIFNMAIFVGLSVGPLAGGVIHDYFGMNAAFYFMTGFSVIGLLLAIFYLPPRAQEMGIVRPKEPQTWKKLLENLPLRGLCIFRVAYTTCIGMMWGFLPILADVKFQLSSSKIGILVMLGIFVSGILHVPMGFVADRWNRKHMLWVGGLLSMVGMCLLVVADGFWGLFGATCLFGLGGGMSMPALMALSVLIGNETKSMGSVMSLMTMSHSVGMMLGSLMAGVMMDYFQLSSVFLIGAASMLVSVCLIAKWGEPMNLKGV